MKRSPFSYRSGAHDNVLIGREIQHKLLYDQLTGGVNTLVLAPPGEGKSSLLEKVRQEILLREKSLIPVVLNLYPTTSMDDFMHAFSSEVIKASTTKWDEFSRSVRDLFDQVIPKVRMVKKRHNEFELGFDLESLQENPEEIFDLAETLANQKNLQFVIFLDDIQRLFHPGNHPLLEKMLQQHWQSHQRVTYCLSGSKQHELVSFFRNPVYRVNEFGTVMLLERIPEGRWKKYLEAEFDRSGKTISEAGAEHIAVLMKGHPGYVQQLADLTWKNTARKASEKEILAGLREMIRIHTPYFRLQAETLSKTQLNLVKALLSGAKRLTSTAVMQQFDLGTPRNVSKNKFILMEKEIIRQDEYGFEFIDPCFELWFRDLFLGESVTGVNQIYASRDKYKVHSLLSGVMSKIKL